MVRFFAVILAFGSILDGSAAIAQTRSQTVQNAQASVNAQSAATDLEERARDVVALLNGEITGEDLFAPVFLNAVSLDEVAIVSKQATDQFGPALRVESVENPSASASLVMIRMERAIAKVGLSIDPQGDHRITGLRLMGFTPMNDALEKIIADLNALDGDVSAYFGPIEGVPGILAINAEQQMPLGSTMKLYVLGALGAQIKNGERHWSDVVTVDRKSFPSGQMQNWPTGSPVTLHSLASLMISISDNTATDTLIRLLGRETIAQYLEHTAHFQAERNAPFLTTRKAFLLKGSSSQTLAAYAQASPEEREAILARLEDNPASLAQINAKLNAGPVAIDTVEWFASTSDLARLFQVMRAESDPEVFRIMAINPAMPGEVIEKWDYLGFKGGSETGVLNLTWLLTDRQGRDRMLVLSWSNSKKAVDTESLHFIAQRILSLTL